MEEEEEEDQYFKCLVHTLGTNLWRETTSTTTPPPPYSKSAVFCGGALFWRSTSEISMLLSFDLHHETFHVIQLPAECVTTTTTTEQQQQQQQQSLVHLLGWKGCLCVARLEKKLASDDYYKVHLHLLKDDVKQVWIKEETFDIIISCFNNTSTSRIVSLCDRVILSWVDGERLQFYDLHRKRLRVVTPRAPTNGLPIFRKELEIENPSHDYYTDYQLHSYAGNFLSLQTFAPEGGLRLDGRYCCFTRHLEAKTKNSRRILVFNPKTR